ncbi:MAG: hypothetical protein AAF984_04365 [Verrucomicrobiota bacterium]
MSTKTAINTCSTCKHWSAKDVTGECRRHAPQTIVFDVDSETKIESRFPVTSSDDWCGDFQAK